MGDTKRKIAFFSPYLDILGGGERFILTMAEYLSEREKVVLFWNNPDLIENVKNKLGIDLSRVDLVKIPFNCLERFFKLYKFDSFVYMTDGSLFMSPCRNNYLIIQSPAHIPYKSLFNGLKLSRFKFIICYSDFVRNYIKQRWDKKILVIPPPVLVDQFKPKKKENLIISVGRFFNWLHAKKQDVLVSAFKKLCCFEEFKNWRLVLIGSVDKGGESYFRRVQRIAEGYPISLFCNTSIVQLKEYYGKAKIYWHAAGFGEDLKRYPEKAEHFGLTTVEAMSAGCVPLVFNAGGQKEIVKEGENGYLWNTVEELIDKTRRISSDDKKLNILSKKARSDSFKYSLEAFTKKIDQLLLLR